MPTDLIRYDLLAQDALRGVVKRVLVDAAREGLPGDHHFYITFDTRAPGVRLSNRMREKYPQEMTVVLQHQFWDLVVTEHTFEVGLSFGGIPERLLIPFEAVKGFFDPSVQFGLQFEVAGAENGEPGEATVREVAPPVASLAPVDTAAPQKSAPREAGVERAPKAAGEEPAREPEAGGAEVVSLDKFRKK
ncbi:MAG: SspB family protein [Proteobacteria bacterium]|nr:SspB family protein [Pseudomonadota bacterium]